MSISDVWWHIVSELWSCHIKAQSLKSVHD